RAHHAGLAQSKVARVDAAEAPADDTDFAAGRFMDLRKPIAQGFAHLDDATGVASHFPGIGVESEMPEIAPQRSHRQIAGEKARQRQHRMPVSLRRSQKERS